MTIKSLESWKYLYFPSVLTILVDVFWYSPCSKWHTHSHKPWAQHRSRSFAGFVSLSAVVHPPAEELVRNHDVEQEDEHGGIHPQEQNPVVQPRWSGWEKAERICGSSTGWRMKDENRDSAHNVCAMLRWTTARPAWWQRTIFRSPESQRIAHIFLSVSMQLTGDIGGCCRRDPTVAKDVTLWSPWIWFKQFSEWVIFFLAAVYFSN